MTKWVIYRKTITTLRPIISKFLLATKLSTCHDKLLSQEIEPITVNFITLKHKLKCAKPFRDYWTGNIEQYDHHDHDNVGPHMDRKLASSPHFPFWKKKNPSFLDHESNFPYCVQMEVEGIINKKLHCMTRYVINAFELLFRVSPGSTSILPL